jgi:PKD domain
VIAPPTVSLAVDHSSAAKGATLHFTASADDPDGGSIDEYRFSVDGSVVQTGASATLSRRFDAPGSHTVSVRAKDDEGQTATATKTVTISAPSGGGTTGGGTGGGPSAPPPTGGGGSPGGGSPPTPALAASKQKLKAVLSKGLALRVTCSAPCTLKLQLVVDKKTAKKLKLGKKATVIGTLTRSISGSTKLKIKLTGKARKALKKARSLKLTVRASAGGAAVTKRVTVKR